MRLWNSIRPNRFWEVDALRGVAIVMMVIYHFTWDLWFFHIVSTEMFWSPFWKLFQRTTASLFLLLVGVSLTISYNRRKVNPQANGPHTLFWSYLRRGLYILGFGVIIGLFTRAAGTGRVDFGILHLIGAAIIITYPLLPYRWLNLVLGILILVVGPSVQALRVDTLWLVWLGPRPEYYPAVDYFSLMPWLGVVLIGIFLGNTLYAGGAPRFTMPQIGHWPPVRLLQLLGRNSLFIYLIHQPLLYGIVYLLVVLAGVR
ncbi:MAG: DUF1624 domain-containing protein [Caldilineaceae bacterium]|nr:DUF1624 domain-containing protein [Caldilineaceae bacterium]